MFGLEKLFGKEIEDVALSKDRIAEMLKVSPEALASFEQAYAKAAIDEDEQGGLFCTNSRQAAAKNKKLTGNEPEAVSKLVERIVVELAAQTPVYVYDGKQGTIVKPTALPESTSFVSNTDISQVPTELRPQLSGNLMQVDIAGLSSESLMFYWDMFQKAKDPKKKKFAYDHFRQGLDILDLDALTYAIIGTNRKSMGDWLPPHTEYRVFVDCDTKDVIGISPYWEPETMLKRFSGEEDADIPHQMHDYVIYKAHEEALMRRYHENKDSVVDHTTTSAKSCRSLTSTGSGVST